MVPYYDDYPEDATVTIPFNTFTSDDPSASVTVSDLADADIKVHKDGSTDEIVTDGATIAIDFDGVTGNHVATIDTSADAAYSVGSEYMVRIEGVTVDGATINAFIGSFSIERAGGALALAKLIQAAVITNAAGTDVAADIIAIKAETADIVADTNELQGDDIPGALSTHDGKLDTVDGLCDDIKAATITNAAGTDVAADIIAVKAETALIVADTNELQGDDIPGALATHDGKLDTVDTVVDGIQTDLSNGTDGLGALKALIDALAGVTLLVAEIDSVTDQTHFTLETGSTSNDAYNDMGIILYDFTNSYYPHIRKVTDYVGATKTVTLSAAPGFALSNSDRVLIFAAVPGSTAPTVGEIQAELEEDGASVLDTIRDELANGTDGLSALKALIDTIDGIVDNILVDTAELQTDDIPGALSTHDGKLDTVDGLCDDIKAAVVTNAAGTDIAADIIAVKAETADIVADTNELQGDDIPGALSTHDGKLDTVDGIVDDIVADTAELQGDDVPGLISTHDGKLDTVDGIVDAIKAKTDNLPGSVPKNVELANFPFLMTDSTDHDPKASAANLAGTIQVDGGAFGALTNAEVEIANGMYKVTITQAEMNHDILTLRFTADDCDDRFITIITDS